MAVHAWCARELADAPASARAAHGEPGLLRINLWKELCHFGYENLAGTNSTKGYWIITPFTSQLNFRFLQVKTHSSSRKKFGRHPTANKGYWRYFCIFPVIMVPFDYVHLQRFWRKLCLFFKKIFGNATILFFRVKWAWEYLLSCWKLCLCS